MHFRFFVSGKVVRWPENQGNIFTVVKSVPLLPGKLTCPLKFNGWKMHFLSGGTFQCFFIGPNTFGVFSVRYDVRLEMFGAGPTNYCKSQSDLSPIPVLPEFELEDPATPWQYPHW